MQQLPVIESVKDAIGYTMSNITLLVKASMFWVALYAILVAIFDFSDGGAYMQVIANFSERPIELSEGAFMNSFEVFMQNLANFGSFVNILYIAMMLVGIVAYYSIAIAWHRACLLDEVPPLVRLGKLEFKYFGYSVLLVLVFYGLFVLLLFVASLIAEIILGSEGALAGSFILICTLAFLVMFILSFGRFTLVFPGIAVRDRRMSFRMSWDATKGNSWRILGGVTLCILPALVVSFIGSLIGLISLPLVISLPIIMVLQLLSGAFLLSFMSICYQFLVPSPDEGDLA